MRVDILEGTAVLLYLWDILDAWKYLVSQPNAISTENFSDCIREGDSYKKIVYAPLQILDIAPLYFAWEKSETF